MILDWSHLFTRLFGWNFNYGLFGRESCGEFFVCPRSDRMIPSKPFNPAPDYVDCMNFSVKSVLLKAPDRERETEKPEEKAVAIATALQIQMRPFIHRIRKICCPAWWLNRFDLVVHLFWFLVVDRP